LNYTKHPLQKLFFVFIVFLFISCTSTIANVPENMLTGFVLHEGDPVSGAIVRIQATENLSVTDEKGYFELRKIGEDGNLIITAWKEGHYIGSIEAIPSIQSVTIHLSKYNKTDNPDYDWIPDEGGLGSIGCAECHPAYDEWLSDAHSQSAVNPRFLSMYNGTDAAGNQSPLTRYGYNRDYGNFPLLPDLNQPYYGPGYKLDFPDSAGNCATCHVPSQAAYPGKEYTSNPNEAEGIEKEGIFCDFCHKIGDVSINPSTGLPNPNMPGILSIELFRPEEGDKDLFLGNFDDVVGPDSYLPLYEESAYCAPCHFSPFWDTLIYNSFGEWLESPYSDPEEGQTCQECHMPAVDYEFFVYEEKGGVQRDPETIFDHNMTGFMEEELMQNAVMLSANLELVDDQIELSIDVVNDQTGHAVPTDFPLRQVILIIEVIDEDGNPLVQVSGDTIPFYGGEGAPEEGYYAGLPGKIYMKVLQEIWTEIYPSGSYWNPTRILSDNRLMPFEKDNSTFVFNMGNSNSAKIQVRLLFRRATKELMDQKGWDVPDILMEETTLIVER